MRPPIYFARAGTIEGRDQIAGAQRGLSNCVFVVPPSSFGTAGRLLVEQLLIAGIDTVVGANLAAHLSDHYRVLGISDAASISIDGCETAVAPADDSHAVRQLLACNRPDRMIVCGSAGDSSWHRANGQIANPTAIESSRAWVRTARELNIPLTLISSDAVFTGP
jgi:dTDP-4-dehydrorhamnose reductase